MILVEFWPVLIFFYFDTARAGMVCAKAGLLKKLGSHGMTCCTCSRKMPRVGVFLFLKESRDLFTLNISLDMMSKIGLLLT